MEKDRLRLEAQTHRNHRLESLGQLAGGIAHDFNNILGVVVNYAGFVIEEAQGDKPDLATIVSDAQQMIRAGERGAALTRHLAGFARREVVRLQAIDLNAVIIGFEEMLRASIGDRITLDLRLDTGLPPVTSDPGQIEQLLLSLALNARDAMPDGGHLVIETARRDDQMLLRVSDSGHGMPPDVVERAFEPFFTTKDGGAGTGLGLATVRGIVTQAGGTVAISSQPPAGATVTVLLPLAGAVGRTQTP